MKKLLLITTLCLLIISSVYALSLYDNVEADSPTIMDFIEDSHKEKCELNKVSTQECPTYSADYCTKDSWFIE